MRVIPPTALAGPPHSSVSTKKKTSTGEVMFFPQGRDAISYVCRALGIGLSDCVLAPALICRSAIDPIIATGARVQFVEIAADLDYDQALLEAAFAQYRPKVLLAVHHFGRRPRLERYRDLCNQFGAVLIEDCCHSLPSSMDFSADLVGDYAIYSLRKFLPVPDGGMLVCRESRLPLPSVYGALSFSAYGKFFLQHIGKALFYSGIHNPYTFRQWRRKLGGRLEASVPDALDAESTHVQAFAYGLPQRGASQFLAKWLDGENLATVIDKHRHNCRQIAALLPSDMLYRPTGDFFDAKSVPVALPIMDLSSEVDLVERLRSFGIGAYAWPGSDLPTEVRGKYPQAERLALHLVMLPIHYGLTESDLSYVASVVGKEGSHS